MISMSASRQYSEYNRYRDVTPPDQPAPSAVDRVLNGWTAFSGVMLLLAGSFGAINGVIALLNKNVYVQTQEGVILFNFTQWGWIHLIGGVLVVLAGLSVLKGHMYGRIIGTGVAVVSALANFAWLPYQPWWSILMIALAFAVIWALTVHGRDVATPAV